MAFMGIMKNRALPFPGGQLGVPSIWYRVTVGYMQRVGGWDYEMSRFSAILAHSASLMFPLVMFA